VNVAVLAEPIRHHETAVDPDGRAHVVYVTASGAVSYWTNRDDATGETFLLRPAPEGLLPAPVDVAVDEVGAVHVAVVDYAEGSPAAAAEVRYLKFIDARRDLAAVELDRVVLEDGGAALGLGVRLAADRAGVAHLAAPRSEGPLYVRRGVRLAP